MTDDALIATIALDEWLNCKARIAELEAALRDAQNRLLQVTEPWRGARADIIPAAVAAIVPLLNEWQCLLRSAPSDATVDRSGEPQ